MKARLLCGLTLSMLAVGCGPTTRSYSVVIQNNGAEPMTCWLTKDGPPAEPQWLSPEQIAIGGAPKNEPIWALVIKPGATGETPKAVSGKFESGTSAVLRVYRGQQLFNNLLAISPDSSNRTDVKLTPGANTIVIDASGAVIKK